MTKNLILDNKNIFDTLPEDVRLFFYLSCSYPSSRLDYTLERIYHKVCEKNKIKFRSSAYVKKILVEKNFISFAGVPVKSIFNHYACMAISETYGESICQFLYDEATESYSRNEASSISLVFSLIYFGRHDFFEGVLNKLGASFFEHLNLIIKENFDNFSLDSSWIETRPIRFQYFYLKYLVELLCFSKKGEKYLQNIKIFEKYRENKNPEHAVFADLLDFYDLIRSKKVVGYPNEKPISSQLSLFLYENTHVISEKKISVFLKENKLYYDESEQGQLNYFFGILHHLLLLENHSKKGFEAFEKIATKNDIFFRRDEIFGSLLKLFYVLKGITPKKTDFYKSSQDLPPIYEAVLIVLRSYLEYDKLSLKKCRDLFRNYKEDYPLAAKMIADVLKKIDPQNQEVHTFLSQKPFCDYIDFASLFDIKENWQMALENLDHYFQKNTPELSLNAKEKKKRIGWIYNFRSHVIEGALEQSFNNGRWSKGKLLSFRKLIELSGLEYATLEDRKVINALQRDRYRSNEYFWDKIRMQEALINHPCVFDVSDYDYTTPVEIVGAVPELLVKKVGENHYHLSLSHWAESEEIFVEPEGPNRWCFVHFKQDFVPLGQILGKNGIQIPEKAKDHFLSVVQKAGTILPIHSDVDGIGLPCIEADPTPCLQLNSLESSAYGLKAQLFVRPFTDKGPYLKPNQGRVMAHILENGTPLQAKRNFELEKSKAVNFLKKTKVLKVSSKNQSYEWDLEDPNDCLDLLANLREEEEKAQNQNKPAPFKVEWPKGKKIQISETIDFNKVKLKINQSRDWFHVDGEVQINDETVIGFKQLLKLLDHSNNRFVKLDEGHYVALTNGLKKQLEELRYITETDKDGHMKINTFGLQTLDDFAEKVKELEVDQHWKKRIETLKSVHDFRPEISPDFKAELRDYQKDGFFWMSRLAYLGFGACLADDMGLGKTIQSLAMILSYAPKGPCVVVAPTSVCHNWEEEIERFAPSLKVHTLLGKDRHESINQLGPMDILICSYTLLQQEIDLLSQKKYAMIILDEAQAIKNASTKRFRAAIQLEGDFKLALSGTPIENSLEEIWSLFRFIAPGLLSTQESFNKRFIIGDRETESMRRQALKSLIRPFILRRTKTDVLSELPPKTEQTIHIDMEDDEKHFYEALRQTAIDNLSNMNETNAGTRKIHILSELTRLRRACCHPKLIDDSVSIMSSKVRVFMDLVHELLENDHKALVFSQYVSYLDLLKSELDKAKIKYEYLDGSTPAKERQARVNAFQEGESSLFLLSLKAGGSGLNLTAADYVIHMDPWWNPAVEDQASDRAHRMGQTRPVTIYRLVMRGSVEERILQLHEHKRELADELLEGTGAGHKLSENELLALLKKDF